MATSMLLQQAAPGAVAKLPVPSARRNEVYTMLQAPSIGGVRQFGAGRKGYGVCRRRTVLVGFRAQSGLFPLLGTKKVKKDEAEESEPGVSLGTRKIRKLPGALNFGKGKKDNKVVYVAGATGKVGSRVVRELLELGFQVRAGVRDVARGQGLLEMLDETTTSADEPISWAAKLFKPRTPSKSKRVELVECDLENEDAIESSLGNAGVVICAVGASEKEVLDATGPYRIDYKATENLIKAATNTQVNHFILVTSLGTTKLGWPASILNLFWGVLVWKAKAEKALEECGLPYTIVRPGGMERPTDAFKETHNLVLAPKDTYSGGQVSSLQVAELIATCVSNLDIARYKVLEVIAETAAPLRPIEDLLAEALAETDEDDQEISSSEDFPSPVRNSVKVSRQQEEKSRKVAEADEKRKKDLQEKVRKAAELDEKKKKELLARYERDLLAAREEEEEAKGKADEALSLKAQLEKRTADLQVQARTAAKEVKKAKALENAMLAAARQGRRLSEKEKSGVLEAAAAEFDGVPKTRADTENVPVSEKKTPVASTNSKPEKGLKFKALQAAKLKEADDRAAKKSAENDRLLKQQGQLVQNEKKADVNNLEMANPDNETQAKAEAEEKAQAEKDRITQERSEAKAKKNAEAKAQAEARAQAQAEARAHAEAKAQAQAEARAQVQAEKDRITREENEAKAKKNAEAKAQAEAKARAQAEKNRTTREENEAKAKKDAEVMLNKARKAKEEAAARAVSNLEKAKAATYGSFRWQRQKGSTKDDVSSKTSIDNVNQEQSKDVPLQVDSEPEPSSTTLQESETKGTAEQPENSTEQPPNVINGLAAAVTEVAESAEDALDSAGITKEAPKVEVGSLSEPEGGNNGAPQSSENASQPPSVLAAAEEGMSKLGEEVVEDTEAMVKKARNAKAEAAARAAAALKKAKGGSSRGFQWPWQKKSAMDNVSSKTPGVIENPKRSEDVPPLVDPKPESSSATLQESETKGTAEQPENSTEQPPNVINGLAAAVTEVAESAEDALDSAGITKEAPKVEEGSLSESEEENNGAPQSSENASQPVSAASDETVPGSPYIETSPPSSVSATDDGISKFDGKTVEDKDAVGEKARNAKAEAAARAAVALEKAKGAATGSFRWPWQEK